MHQLYWTNQGEMRPVSSIWIQICFWFYNFSIFKLTDVQPFHLKHTSADKKKYKREQAKKLCLIGQIMIGKIMFNRSNYDPKNLCLKGYDRKVCLKGQIIIEKIMFERSNYDRKRIELLNQRCIQYTFHIFPNPAIWRICSVSKMRMCLNIWSKHSDPKVSKTLLEVLKYKR